MSPRLQTATLGRTGLEVTRLGYGAMEVSGRSRARPVSDEEAGEILNAVVDAGINYIDTSIDYGRSEEFIGKYLSGRRSEYYIATKCGCWAGEGEGPSRHVYTRENIEAGVDQSLARMGTDYLDVVQFHGSPSKETLENDDAVETLSDLKALGKVRFLGMSSTLPDLADHVAMGVFDVLQIPYSALAREHESWITKAAEEGTGTVIRGGVAKGEDLGKARPLSVWERFDEAGLDELRQEGESRTAFMLRFTLAHPNLHTTIVGTKDPQHLKENLQVAEQGPLAVDTYEEAKRRLGKIGVEPAALSGS